MAVAERGEPSGRERILDAAARLFLADGYGETSLRDIAAEASLQAASIYHHFSSKDELLTEVLRLGLDRIGEQLDVAAERMPATTDGWERLLVLVRAHLRGLFELGPYTAVNVMVFPVAPPAVQQATVPDRDRYEARWDAALRALADEGALAADLDVPMARRILLGAANSSLEWFRADGDTTVDELAETITDLVWRGIAAR